MKEYFVGISGTPLKLKESFVCGRYQHILLNGQASSWLPILAVVPQVSILGPLFFLIYINDLSQNLSWTAKLFADDTSVFSIVHDIDSSTKQLNDNLKMILHWAYQWKMYFNPDFCKQAPKLTFSSKSSRVDHRSITSNNSSVARTSCQKQEKISKACKGIDVIRKLHYVLPRHSLLTIYKSFIRPHLDYGDIIYG